MNLYHIFVWWILLSSFQLAFGKLMEGEMEMFQKHNVTVSQETIDGVVYHKIEHHGIPNHKTGDFPTNYNPNTIMEQNHVFYVPVDPEAYDIDLDGSYGCLPLGPIGTTVNGIPFYSPYSAQGYNAVEGDNREIFDQCDGHPDPRGAYHYHKIPGCVHMNTSMEFLGVALDGYAIYGPYDENGNPVREDSLDICHGRKHNGRYIYHATDNFPYILGCYHGKRKDGSNVVNETNVRPPSRDGRPPPQDGRPPPQDGRPPPQDGRPPPQDGRPPPQDGRPPSRNGRPPPAGGRPHWLTCYAECENPAEPDTCDSPASNTIGTASELLPSVSTITVALLSLYIHLLLFSKRWKVVG